MYTWEPFESHYDRSIAHHEARAAYWRAQDNESYALASLAKAARWEDKKREWEAFMRPYPETALSEITQHYMLKIKAEMLAHMERSMFGAT